jgi:hypothetical protein
VIFEDLVTRINAELQRLKQVMDTDLPSYNRLVREQNVPAVIIKAAREEERGKE